MSGTATQSTHAGRQPLAGHCVSIDGESWHRDGQSCARCGFGIDDFGDGRGHWDEPLLVAAPAGDEDAEAVGEAPRLLTPLLPFEQPAPATTHTPEETPAPAIQTRDETPRTPPPGGKRQGYQICARPADDPDDPGTCTYTESTSEEGALSRARQEFPPDEGWVDHEAQLIPGAC